MGSALSAFVPDRNRTSKVVAGMIALLDRVTQRTLFVATRDCLSAVRHAYRCRPPLGWVKFGHLRRLTPFNRRWGYVRGLPVDRYYIENFLAGHAQDIHGHVLEIGRLPAVDPDGCETAATQHDQSLREPVG